MDKYFNELMEERFSGRGLVVSICSDENPLNPRTDRDNLGKMFCLHPNYIIGDEQFSATTGFASLSDVESYLRKEREAVLVFPLQLLDHSGLKIKIGSNGFVGDEQGWDTTNVGFIYVSKEDIVKEYGAIDEETLANAQKVLEGEVEEYDSYLSGDAYGYVIRDPRDGEVVDSCWGYRATDIKEATKEAVAVVDLAELNQNYRTRAQAQVKAIQSSLDLPLEASVDESPSL